MDLLQGNEVIVLKWSSKPDKMKTVIQKHNARLVAKDYLQQPGIDFDATFAPVVRMETIQCVLTSGAQMGLNIYQLDVKSAFVIGEIEDQVYVHQPQSYEIAKVRKKCTG